LHGRHLNLFQAEGAMATGAIEMGVLFLIVVVVFTVVVADVVFQRPAAVIHGMYKSVKEEKGKCAGYGAFINGWQQLFQPWQRQHLIATVQLLKYEQPRGGGFYVMML
jgi:hypothetical protein